MQEDFLQDFGRFSATVCIFKKSCLPTLYNLKLEKIKKLTQIFKAFI